MSERSLTIWNLLVGITIVSLIATGFKLFPMNKKYNRVKARSSNVQFGTDKELENIIGFLESRLEERSKFQFQIENTPMMLTNVLSLTDGSGKRARRNRNAIRVALVYQRDNNYQAQIDYRGKAFTVTIGDSIPNIGVVEFIDNTQVIIKTNSGIKAYPTPNRKIENTSDRKIEIKVTSSKLRQKIKESDSANFFATQLNEI
tara:strand:- start:95 stop:700 length:606 start_codon:yes stop_codon:yes gene_type:complete